MEKKKSRKKIQKMNQSTYSTTFVYSDLSAKAQAHSAKPGRDSASPVPPWADLPQACLGRPNSTVQEDFQTHKKITSEHSLDEIKRKFMQKLRQRREASEDEAYRIEVERRKELSRQIDEKFAPKEVSTVFSFEGVKVQRAADEHIHRAQRLELLVAKEKERGFAAQASVQRSSSSLDGPDPTRYAYLNPTQRQRLKYNLLEAQRLDQFKSTLTSNGWTESTVPNAAAKMPLHPERKTTLTAEEAEKIEMQLEALKQLREAAATRATAATSSTSGFPAADNTSSMEDLHHRQQLRNGRSSGKDDEDPTMSPPKFLRALPMKPEALYRPELPLSRLPTQEVIDSVAALLDKPKSLVAPPWGRQTLQDDKWERVRVWDSRSQTKRFESVGKLEVDHELKVVRDGGLLRKERTTLLKSLDPKTLAIVRSLPPSFGRKGNNSSSVAMKQAAKLPSASLASS